MQEQRRHQPVDNNRRPARNRLRPSAHTGEDQRVQHSNQVRLPGHR